MEDERDLVLCLMGAGGWGLGSDFGVEPSGFATRAVVTLLSCPISLTMTGRPVCNLRLYMPLNNLSDPESPLPPVLHVSL